MAYYKKGNKEAHIGGYLFQPDCNTVWCLGPIATLTIRQYEEELAPFYHSELRK